MENIHDQAEHFHWKNNIYIEDDNDKQKKFYNQMIASIYNLSRNLLNTFLDSTEDCINEQSCYSFIPIPSM
jgi:hypothetical protein